MPGQPSPAATARYLYGADSQTKDCGSVCVSFTSVSEPFTSGHGPLSALVRDTDGRW